MTVRKSFLAFIVLLFLTAVCFGNPEEMKDFENDEVGTLPSGFVSYKGEWKVIHSEGDVTTSKVLAQLAANSGTTFNMVLWDTAEYQQIDLSVKIKAVAGQQDQGGGLIWRAKDENNYYIARTNPLEENYRVYKVQQGKRIQLQSADVKSSPGWHHLRIVMKEGHIEGYWDGTKYLDVADDTFTVAGKVGLWTKADAQTYFDDFTVHEIR